jgi:NAD(P)-dependent dehydrogenase (short-subunit alcohol dehydrogenase family)
MKFKHKVLLAGLAGGALYGFAEKRAKANERNLSGAVVAITGGSRGLGLALARAFADEGCRIAICARDQIELDAAREDLEKRGARVLAFQCDVVDQEEVEAFARAASTRFERIDIWVNNAAIIKVGPAHNTTLGDYHEAMAINFWGTVHGTFAALPQMLERGNGHIVNITSVGGKIGLPHLSTYSAAKFAAQGFTESLSAELAGTGVLVTAIAPGMMRTGSFVASEYIGEPEKEIKWFGAQATLPLPAPIGPLSAENAAALVVRAVKRGQTLKSIPAIPFDILARLHGLLPEAGIAVLSRINALLPAPTSPPDSAKGEALVPQMDESLLKKQFEAGARQGETLKQSVD